MFEIPAVIVALFALFVTIVVFTHNENVRIPIKVFALTSLMQFFAYLFFAFIPSSIETKQFVARSNVITSSLALSIILLIARWKR